MGTAAEIEERLRAAFAPEAITVIDESERHRGHAGYREGGESHFRIRLRASALDGLGRVDRHRAIHRALGPEIVARIHALAIEVDSGSAG